MGDKWAWVFNASDVQQVMLNAVLLTPTPFFPGTAPFPAMTLLFMWLQDEPDREADPAEKQTSPKKALFQVNLLHHWPCPYLHAKGTLK